MAESIRSLRADRDKWKQLARNWQKLARQHEADREVAQNQLEALRADMAKSARRAALLPQIRG
jgi:uncharacterized protein involved in exopolysaccharide biosynthesis